MKRVFQFIIAAVAALGAVLNRAVFGYMANRGLILSAIPTAAEFNRYRVTDPNQSEVIRQRLYDFQIYPAAGQTQLTFFQNQAGTGKTSTPGAVAGSAKTWSDTNMTASGTLPSGMQYLIETVEVVFLPGSVSTADTFTPINLATANTAALSAANVNTINDINLVYNTGLLTFNVLNKVQLREYGLKSFPPKTQIKMDAALAAADTNATTAVKLSALNAFADGRPYYLEPQVSLQPATNFNVTIDYPAAQALPSGFNGRIGVMFDGYLMRAAQ